MLPVERHQEGGQLSVQPKAAGEWRSAGGLPGHPLMWVLVGSEFLIFGAALLAFSVMRVLQPLEFLESQDHLNRLAGAANTMILLTSGLFAAQAAHLHAVRAIRFRLALAGLLGSVFLIVKGIEYRSEIAAGHGILTNDFFTLFYLITGFHALHVVLGIAILGVVAAYPTRTNVETGTVFWHMIDIVWLLVFPVLYLIR